MLLILQSQAVQSWLSLCYSKQNFITIAVTAIVLRGNDLEYCNVVGSGSGEDENSGPLRRLGSFPTNVV